MNDDLLGLLERIRKAVHDALPDKTDPLELDAAIEVALRENAELGKRYEQLEQMVTRRMGELEAENERLRAKLANYEALSATNQTSPDLWELVAKLKVELEDYHALITLQHRRTVDADRIYQEAHGWPNTQFPDLGELIGWLLEQYVKAVAQSEHIQRAGLTEFEMARKDAEIEQLRAKNERLRAALTPISEHWNWQISEADSYGSTNYEWVGDGGEAFEIAAAALASTQ